MLQVSISAPNKHRPFLPLLCYSSPLLGRCPLSKGPAEMHHHPLGSCCLICWGSCSGVCWGHAVSFPPLLTQILSPTAGFPGSFCTSSAENASLGTSRWASPCTDLSQHLVNGCLSLLAQSLKHPLIINSLITSRWKSQAPRLLFPDEAGALTLQEFPEIPEGVHTIQVGP